MPSKALEEDDMMIDECEDAFSGEESEIEIDSEASEEQAKDDVKGAKDNNFNRIPTAKEQFELKQNELFSSSLFKLKVCFM